MDKQQALQYIEQNSNVFCSLSDKIWELAELSLLEYKSMETYCDLLRKLGFEVETGLCGVPTAFSGKFGSGKPVVGILGEFDALSDLSQVAGATSRQAITEGGAGHGCGHNLLGAGALAAACAVKEYLRENKLPGTVIFFGCPGEEGGAGKAFMARDGLWKELDAALTWHPDDRNYIVSGTNNCSIQKEYQFTGIASHAAGSPHLGRSALDAVELMNVGVQFLREHMPGECRVHYAITDAGGCSPNVVQPRAQVLYMVRSIWVKDALQLLERVDKIAQGAALMTETTLKTKFIDGTSNLLPNFTLEKVLYDNFAAVGVPQYSDAERELAQSYIDTFEIQDSALPGVSADSPADYRQFMEKMTEGGSKPLNDFLEPLSSNERFVFGSTDVGDVSWLTPTAQMRAVTYPSRQPSHSWQNVACGKSSIAYKGMLCAGKVIAGAAIDLLENPSLLEQAKEEFDKRSAVGFLSPIPQDAKPVVAGEKF